MKSKPYSEMSTEELLKIVKPAKIVSIMLGAAIIGLFLLNLYNGEKGWKLLGVPLPLSVIVLINLNNVREINKELKTRA